MSERTRNPACTLLTVLVLVLAGREVQRTFFGDSDELAQDFTADELAGILSIRKGMWELPEITEENTLSIGVAIDGVDQPGMTLPLSSSTLERLRGEEEIPFTARYWLSGDIRYMRWGTLGGSVTWAFNDGGRDYEVRSYSVYANAEQDGIISEYQVEDEDGTPHEVAFRFKFIRKD